MNSTTGKLEVHSTLSEDFSPSQDLMSLTQRSLACGPSNKTYFSALDAEKNLWISLNAAGTNAGCKLVQTRFASLASATMLSSSGEQLTFGSEMSDLFVLRGVDESVLERMKLNFTSPFEGALLEKIKPVSMVDGPVCMALFYKDGKGSYNLSLLTWNETEPSNMPSVWHTPVVTNNVCGDWFLNDFDSVAFVVPDQHEPNKMYYCDITENRVTEFCVSFPVRDIDSCHRGNHSSMVVMDDKHNLYTLKLDDGPDNASVVPFFTSSVEFDSFKITYAADAYFLLACAHNGTLYSCTTPSVEGNDPSSLQPQESSVSHYELDKFDHTAPHYTFSSALGNDAGGNIHINHYNSGTRLWEDADSLGEEVESEFRRYYCYTTDVRLMDDDGVPCSDTAIELWAAADCRVSVNNLMYYIGPNQKITVWTNKAGKLTLHQYTETISAIKLVMQPEGHTEFYTIEPDSQNIDILSNLTGDQLDGARVDGGGRLVDNDFGGETYRKEVLHQSAMAISANLRNVTTRNRLLDEIVSSPRLKLQGTSNRFVKCYKSDPVAMLNMLPANGMGRCRIVFKDDGGVEYTELTAEECRLHRGALYAGLGMELPSDANSIFSKIGDFFKSVFKGLAHMVEVVIDGLKVTISFIENEIKKIGEFIAHTIHEAINLIETVLHYIEVGIKKLVQWIGIFFNWADFIYVKGMLVEHTKSTMETVVSKIRSIPPSRIESLFGKITAEINAAFDKLEGLDPDDTYDHSGESNESKDAKAKAQTNNVIYNKMLNTDTANDICLGLLLTKENTDLLDKIFEKLKGLSDKLGEPVTRFQENIKTILSRKCSIKQLLDLLLEVLRLIVNMAVETGKAITQALMEVVGELFELFWKLLDTPLHIPIVSSLIEFFTHKKVSLLDVLMYVLAVPLTIIYKLLNHCHVPFKKNTDGDAAEYTSTVSCLLYYLFNTFANFRDVCDKGMASGWFDKIMMTGFTLFEIIWVFTSYDFGDFDCDYTLAWFIVDSSGMLYDIAMTLIAYYKEFKADGIEIACELVLSISYILTSSLYAKNKKEGALDACIDIIPGVHDLVQIARFVDDKRIGLGATVFCEVLGVVEPALMSASMASE